MKLWYTQKDAKMVNLYINNKWRVKNEYYFKLGESKDSIFTR